LHEIPTHTPPDPATILQAIGDTAHEAESAFGAPEGSVQMMAFGLIILAAHLGGKLCRRLHLSEITGQLLGGAIAGPYALHLVGVLPGATGGVYDDALHAFHFFIFVFLSMVAFSIGEELHFSRIRRVGRAAISICLIQAGLTWFLITIAFHFIGGFTLVIALLFGSIGIATAPAVTFVLMNQLRIEGRLRHVLGSVVVIDDVIEVIIFSILMQLSLQRSGTAPGFGVLVPVGLEILFAALLGGAIYLVLKLLVRRRARIVNTDEQEHSHRRDVGLLQRMLAEHPSPSAEILIIVMGTVSLGAGFAYHNHWPFLITATLAGFLVANLHSHAIFDSLKIENITSVLNLGFFALIGANISLANLGGETAWLAALYILTRMTGKLFGTWLGCKVMHEERKIRACLPSLMLPQAGVAAVEAVYAGAVLGMPEIAAVILPAIVFFEIVGVYLVDRGLRNWRSWVTGEEEQLRGEQISCPACEAIGRIMLHVSPDDVELNVSGSTKGEVIAELLDHALAQSDSHIDREQALQVLGERELLASTAFGNGIAIPHCRLLGIDEPILVFGRHPTGVDFGGIDAQLCDLFLLMLTPARDPGEHLRLLSASAHIFGEGEIRSRLRSAGDSDSFVEVLRDAAKQPEASSE